jgi:hypothetical protein
MTPTSTLALYTTVYPGVEKFLPDWYRSLRVQTDRDYILWVGLDSVGIEAAKDAMGGDPEAIWVPAAAGDTPAQVRQRAFSQLVESCDGVVLVDSDDVLHPPRVASARVALEAGDLAACALRLIDEEGRDMCMTLGLPPNVVPSDVLPRNNVFGLSNTAFRSDILRRCLPIPSSVTLVDWFLATRAWLIGAALSFDPVARMDYRQHTANLAKVVPPYDPVQVIRDTELVRRHFRLVLATPLDGARKDRLAMVARVADDIEEFHHRVILQPPKLERYVSAVNALELAPLWWSCVAHPTLRHMWTPERDAR